MKRSFLATLIILAALPMLSIANSNIRFEKTTLFEVGLGAWSGRLSCQDTATAALIYSTTRQCQSLGYNYAVELASKLNGGGVNHIANIQYCSVTATIECR